jgi:nicotinamide mononucleotide adenylyltransferase
MNLGTIGVIGRWKPLHLGGAAMLETLCKQAEHVKIGIGSCNKYNLRNPWTAEESYEMISVYLTPRFHNFSVLFIPDYAHIPEYRDGKRWKQNIAEEFGELDYFVTGDKYVAQLLQDKYKILHPGDLVSEDKQVFLKATAVRVEMAKNGNWQQFVPKETAEYIIKNKLDERFRKEFGLQTIAQLASAEYWLPETAEQEKVHTFEK